MKSGNNIFKSPWYFDNFREDVEGEYVKIADKFVGNWSDEITMIKSSLVDHFHNKQCYEHSTNSTS